MARLGEKQVLKPLRARRRVCCPVLCRSVLFCAVLCCTVLICIELFCVVTSIARRRDMLSRHFSPNRFGKQNLSPQQPALIVNVDLFRVP